MAKAIQVHAHGGPEVLRFEDVTTPRPGPGQAVVRHRAIGVNFIDVYFRTGLYAAPQMPFTPGNDFTSPTVPASLYAGTITRCCEL